MKSLLMKEKKGLIMGVANNKSIAWAIARQLSNVGAELAFTYQGDVLRSRVEPLAQSIGSDFLIECDVLEDVSTVFEKIEHRWSEIDFVVHAVAFSDKNELKGRYVDTSRENFIKSLEVSCYSFTEVAHYAAPLMKRGGSLLTLSYLGANRVLPHYNVMGVAKAALEASVRYLAVDLGKDNIRVNALSAGPLKTLAASGIGDFRQILRWNELNAPLKRNVTLEEVGASGLYLLSDLSTAVTGEVHYVDCGYHVVGMVAVDEAEKVGDLLQQFRKQS